MPELNIPRDFPLEKKAYTVSFYCGFPVCFFGQDNNILSQLMRAAAAKNKIATCALAYGRNSLLLLMTKK